MKANYNQKGPRRLPDGSLTCRGCVHAVAAGRSTLVWCCVPPYIDPPVFVACEDEPHPTPDRCPFHPTRTEAADA